jgi:iron complex outermembrane receptor protein
LREYELWVLGAFSGSYFVRKRFIRRLWCVATPLALVSQQARAVDPVDLNALSIEELANLPVRSASKREEPLANAPTSLFVVTADDIAGVGATSLPEALRLAPNLNVQQVDASQYAITARGFNGTETANKLLVLIDGRSVYTPLQSQVFWNLHSPLLEDLQQIEVISGPGGTLYGPNAVNGVINISSRDAQETLGTLVRATGGAYERTLAARHGLALGSNTAVRVYGNFHDREALPTGVGFGGDDGFKGWQSGFRADFTAEANHLTLQGDLFHNKAELIDGDGNRGFNVVGRWSRTLSASASLEVQAYHDRFRREFILVSDELRTNDVSGQINFTSGRHNVVAGAGVRTTKDEFINNLNAFQLDPRSRRLWIGNGFVQDRINLGRGVAIIPGLKVERSTFSGWQLLPSLRAAWQPGDRAMWWAAISRVIRTPSRIDRGLTNLPLLAPAEDFRTEKLVALEAGYRGQPARFVSVSVNTFYNWYDDIRTTELSPGGTLPIMLANGLRGRTWGLEAWGNVQIIPTWRASLGATRFWNDFEMKDGRTDLAAMAALGDDPKWQLKAGTQVDLRPGIQFAADARWISKIETAPRIPGYAEGSARLGWAVNDMLELYVSGRNLLHKTHLESNDVNQGQRAKRSVVAGTRVRF